MRKTKITKLILLAIAVAGIASLGWQLPAYNLLQANKETLYAIHYDNTLQTYLAIGGIIVILTLLIWTVSFRPPRKLYHRFRQLDSNTLDSNTRICREFYQAVLQYRITKGPLKFRRYIINHFNFFYEFHNFALTWIENLLVTLSANKVPVEFMLSAICSGQIGQVFTDAHYASGLPATGLKANDPLIFHARADIIEIWSYDSQRALCKVRKNTIKLLNAHRHSRDLTAILTGIDHTGNRRYQIEIRFLAHDQASGQPHSMHARQRIISFKQWLKDVAKYRGKQRNDYGIDVSELFRATAKDNTPVTRRLKSLEGKQIKTFFARATLPIVDKKVPLDAVVLCDGIGIIAISEKSDSGDIVASTNPVWRQTINNNVREIMNPCIHAQLSRTALTILLSNHDLTRWPIISLVIFSSSNVTLNTQIGRQALQCAAIKLENLEKWLASNNHNDRIRFTDADLTLFKSVLSNESDESVTAPSLQFATL